MEVIFRRYSTSAHIQRKPRYCICDSPIGIAFTGSVPNTLGCGSNGIFDDPGQCFVA